MKVKASVEIRKATKYSDIFSADENTAKKEFREYCKLYHPDANDSTEAAELFSIIQQLYNFKSLGAGTGGSAGASIKEVVFKNKDTGRGFMLTNPVVFNNGLATVYHTATKVVFEYDKTYEKFYKNYLDTLPKLQYADENMRKEFERYFPKLNTNFESTDGKLIILLDKTPDVYNLGVIVKSYEKKHEQFPEKQAAWVLNRLYNIECFFNYNKLVFNGLALDNIWVSPEMHSVLLLSGWEYTKSAGATMIGCPKDVYRTLPFKVKGSKESNILTDLESIKTVGRKLYNNSSNAKNTVDFLMKGVSKEDAITEWDNYSKAIKEDFGKRNFVVWENVPYNL